MNKTKTFKMVQVGLMAALFCIAGPNTIPIPISPVPISFTNLAVFFAAFVLGWKLCSLSFIIYILLGAVGLPVFSGYTGGLAKLAGPTGGYIIGFIFTAMICAFFVEKFHCRIYMNILGMILGMIIAYIFGTAWFMIQQGTSLASALTLCVIPYLIGDALKIAAAAVLGPVIRKSLVKASLIKAEA